MTTPRVIELPRRLESTSRDTFLGAQPDEDGPLATVVVLRRRDRRRGRPPGRGRPALHLVGPGDSAA